MKIPSSLVGTRVGPIAQAIDARWLMAYAAGLGETDARYYDTQAKGGPVAHPLFPVCYEWPVALALRARALTDGIATRSVHAFHDARIHRPPRAGDRLVTTASVTTVEHRPAGAMMTMRMETVDARGAPVSTTEYGSVYRGVAVDGPDRGVPLRPATPEVPLRLLGPIAVPPQMAHVYTECARIWNPIHTDVAVARDAGLPAIILHGTATLALAISRIVAELCDGDPSSVQRVACRFTGMVAMPATLTLRVSEPAPTLTVLSGAPDNPAAAATAPPSPPGPQPAEVTSAGTDALEMTAIRFDVLDESGRAVLRHGAIYR